MQSKISFIKRLQFALFCKCPNCGATITESWYSFLDMRYRYRCGKCHNEYV